jgi:hypothetical protein
MNHAVNRRSFTAEEWIQLHAIFCGIYGGQRDSNTGFSPST